MKKKKEYLEDIKNIFLANLRILSTKGRVEKEQGGRKLIKQNNKRKLFKPRERYNYSRIQEGHTSLNRFSPNKTVLRHMINQKLKYQRRGRDSKISKQKEVSNT